MLGLASLGAGAVLVASLVFPAIEKTRHVARLERERNELNEVVRRLTREDRVADVIVTRQQKDDAGRIVSTEIEFIELDRDGHSLPARRFCLAGRVLYFDALVVKFDRQAVKAGDALKGKSLLLFRRIFSEECAPRDGPIIDADGEVPDVFRVNPRPSEFEKRLWSRFWSYAADPKLAAADGVRVAQGEAVYAPVTAGQRWTLTLDADGGLNLKLVQPAVEKA